MRGYLSQVTLAACYCGWVLAIACACLQASSAESCFCKRREPCWPSAQDVEGLYHHLDPDVNRTTFWDYSPSHPKPTPLATNPRNDFPQVFFGAGVSGLSPVYEQPAIESLGVCFEEGLHSLFCNVSARNNPQNGWSPAYLAFPTNASQVQSAVLFASAHNLEICVAGTGHDFLNRHSCNQGLMIRTSLLKGMEWDFNSSGRFRTLGGTVKLGTGLTWEEVSYGAAQNNRLIASGWCGTVGIGGWTLGGGYGPFTRGLGLGADQLLEAEVVLADGSLAVTNAQGTHTTHPDGTTSSSTSSDLYWALRGGGGSTFGIVTSMTVRAHPLPLGGVTAAVISFDGDLCEGKAAVNTFIDKVLVWIAGLSVKWSGINGMTPSSKADAACNASFHVQLQYAYYGPSSDPEFQMEIQKVEALGAKLAGKIEVQDMYSLIQVSTSINPAFVYISTTNVLGPTTSPLNFTGAFPSVLVSKKVALSGRLAAVIHSANSACQNLGYCISMSLSHGMPAAASTDKRTAVSPGMRDTLIHFWSTTPGFTAETVPLLYSLGDYSYFSESTIQMPEWPFRYWGKNNYKKLLKIKKAVDPRGVFTCHHCVGDKYEGSDAYGLEHFNL